LYIFHVPCWKASQRLAERFSMLSPSPPVVFCVLWSSPGLAYAHSNFTHIWQYLRQHDPAAFLEDQNHISGGAIWVCLKIGYPNSNAKSSFALLRYRQDKMIDSTCAEMLSRS
jgi:hypothetical protein